jgi:uncharacterized protein
MNSFTAPTTYFLQEGRDNLHECLKVSFQAAVQQGIDKMIIFTAYGDGVKIALEQFCSSPEYEHIKLVAVTFPAGKRFTNPQNEPVLVTLAEDVAAMMRKHDVPLVRAHLPFDPIEPGAALQTTVGRGFNLLGETLNMFCGSMSLCVQSVALACDAGYVEAGDHVIALTSDTSILATAAVTRRMLSQLVVREIICKPAILTIGRKEASPKMLLAAKRLQIEASAIKKRKRRPAKDG